MKNWLLLLALTGCYKRDIADCAVSCATSNDCPSGLACTASGLCAASAGTSCGDVVEPDAAPDSPPPATVHVLVFDDRGLPATGVRVIASAFADGAAFDDRTTIADGTADLEVTGDADITAVTTNGVGSQLTTLRAIAPGTSVTFGRRRNEPATVSRTITWPTNGSAIGSYFIHTSCNDDGTSVPVQGGVSSQSTTIQLDPTCADNYDVTVVFTDGATSFSQSQPNNTGNATLNGLYGTFSQANANFSQLPSNVVLGNTQFTGNTIFRTADPARGPGFLAPLAGGSGGASAFITLPATGTVGRELRLSMGRTGDEFEQRQTIVERIPANGQYNLAIEPQMLPWIANNPNVDIATRTISWTQIPAGGTARTSGDLYAVELNYERGSADFRWRIVQPASVVEEFEINGFQIRFPDLPGTETFEPQAGDLFGFDQHVRIYGFTAATQVGYANVAPTADLAISFADPVLLKATDNFLLTGLGAVDLTRMVVSFNPPNAP